MPSQAKPTDEPAWIVLDSSCWIEYLRDSPRAALFAPAAESPDRLIVPIVTPQEVTKKLRRELDALTAGYAEAAMRRSSSYNCAEPAPAN